MVRSVDCQDIGIEYYVYEPQIFHGIPLRSRKRIHTLLVLKLAGDNTRTTCRDYHSDLAAGYL